MNDSSKAAVALSGLRHAYGTGRTRATLLDGTELHLQPGEVVALVGRSGSGKSTLLNLIGGLEPVQAGCLRVFGEDLASLDDRARTALRRSVIGFVYQAFNLIPTLNVADNIALPLVLSRVARATRRQRVEAMLQAVGLEGRAATFPDTLSGGEQQRVAIARALVHAPRLLLADEPTGNLDAANGRRALELLLALAGEAGASVLIVTHSRRVAQAADRVLRLEAGRLSPVNAVTLGDDHDAW